MRPSVRGNARRFKELFVELVESSGRLKGAEAFCRVKKSQLQRYCSDNEADVDVVPPVDVVCDLERISGDPIITRYMANMAGGTFVALPKSIANGADILTILGSQTRELGDLATSLGLGLSDGRFCGADARKALKEARDVVAVASQMIAELELIANEGEEA